MNNLSLAAVVCLSALACGPVDTSDADTGANTAASTSASPDTVPAVAGPWTVSAHAFGPIHLGRPVPDIARALSDSLPVKYEFGMNCDFVTPRTLPSGSKLMVVADTVVRVDIDSAGIATAEGARVGDTEARIKSLYGGRVRVQPHKYTDGHYLVVPSPSDTAFQLVFETDGSRVTRFRAGRLPPVSWVEGCA